MWTEIGSFLDIWAVPFGAAVSGALTGGLVTRFVGRGESRRLRRERYGQALLDALGSARIATQDALSAAQDAAAANAIGQVYEGEEILTPLVLREEARDILVNAELAATLERRRQGQLSVKGWALHHHESLLAGCERVDDLRWVDEQLQLGEYLVVACMALRANGLDFARSKAEVIERYGPKYQDRHMPDYASHAFGQNLRP